VNKLNRGTGGLPEDGSLREPKHVGVFIVTLILFRVDATSDVHQSDFNKRILILEMHGTNIKKKLNRVHHVPTGAPHKWTE